MLVTHWNAEWHKDKRPFLLGRNRIVAGVRQWFDAHDFLEVDPCQLVVSPGNEIHLHAFATDIVAPDGEKQRRYLHTSPEFACKKLLAAGEERIFTLSHVFRNGERSALHHPEFTMLEWYRVGEPYTQLMDDCMDVIRLAAETTGQKLFHFRGVEADPFADAERITLAEAFDRYAGIDLLVVLGDVERFRAQAMGAGVRVAADDGWADVFSRVLLEKIEPHLGQGKATVLYEYPLSEAALARPCPHDGRVSERFEIYMCGVELANAFGELTDAHEQRRRFTADMDEKQRIYGMRYPLDEVLLEALDAMPHASGAALGFDRLAMLATGAQRIEQVLWQPVG